MHKKLFLFFNNINADLKSHFSKILLTLFLVLLSAAVNAAPSSCEIEITGGKKEVKREDIRIFFRTSDSVIRNLLTSKKLGNRNIPRTYSLFIKPDQELKKRTITLSQKGMMTFTYPLGEIKEFKKLKPEIIKAMILKYAGMPVNETTMKNLPPWLIFGCLSKINNRLDKSSIPGIFFAPYVHAYVVNPPENPAFLKQISSKDYPDSGPALKLYMEFANILIDSIKKLPKWREGLTDMIDLSVKDGYSPAFFEQIFSKKVHTYLINTSTSINENTPYTDSEFEKWFLDNAVQMSVNIFNPANAAASEKMFRKIEIVNYTAEFENSSGETVHEERCCKIKDLADKKSEIMNFESIVRNKEFEFTLLAYSVPASFQPAIFEIKKTLIRLRAGLEPELFSKMYNEAKNKFFEEVNKQYEIENYMKKMEKRFVPEVWRYQQELTELDNYKKKRTELWKPLYDYISNWKKNNLKY